MTLSTERPGMLVPGLLPRDPFKERYWVYPASVTVLSLEAGDRLSVTDPEGGQGAELTVLSADGAHDGSAIGARADAPAAVLNALLDSSATGARRVIATLASRGLQASEARAVRLLSLIHISEPTRRTPI